MIIKPLNQNVGCTIEDVSLHSASQEELQQIHAAWLQYSVVFIRNQSLTPSEQLKFASYFGEPDVYPFLVGLEGHPEVTRVLKTPKETENFGGVWHTDTIYLEVPPKASMLYAIEVPEQGGDTLFSNQHKAYDKLSNDVKDHISSLQAESRSDLEAVSATRLNRITDSGKASSVSYSASHPMVRTHPDTGLKSLYISPAHTCSVEGLSEEGSRALLTDLFAHQMKEEFQCRFSWRKGDLALWDNRCLLHLPLNDYQGQLRLLHRITLKGDRPF
ncbi:MAG: TauD/TfdA family dioxygenase [Burkholderiales bacterium]|jgi:taurine dioxygenase|tara:strand:- start:1169 stop:1987 length:819 start_codon:yes stop_codon:yes gene_type:complete